MNENLESFDAKMNSSAATNKHSFDQFALQINNNIESFEKKFDEKFNELVKQINEKTDVKKDINLKLGKYLFKQTFTGNTSIADIYALAVLPNGDLASGSADKTIDIWNPTEGTLLRTLTGHTSIVYALTVLPNGDLASGSGDRRNLVFPNGPKDNN